MDKPNQDLAIDSYKSSPDNYSPNKLFISSDIWCTAIYTALGQCDGFLHGDDELCSLKLKEAVTVSDGSRVDMSVSIITTCKKEEEASL